MIGVLMSVYLFEIDPCNSCAGTHRVFIRNKPEKIEYTVHYICPEKNKQTYFPIENNLPTFKVIKEDKLAKKAIEGYAKPVAAGRLST
jgi:hypothetical protein